MRNHGLPLHLVASGGTAQGLSASAHPQQRPLGYYGDPGRGGSTIRGFPASAQDISNAPIGTALSCLCPAPFGSERNTIGLGRAAGALRGTTSRREERESAPGTVLGVKLAALRASAWMAWNELPRVPYTTPRTRDCEHQRPGARAGAERLQAGAACLAGEAARRREETAARSRALGIRGRRGRAAARGRRQRRRREAQSPMGARAALGGGACGALPALPLAPAPPPRRRGRSE